MGRSTQTDCKPMIILAASVIALSSWSSLLIAVIIVWNPHHSMDVEGRVEVPLIIFAFVNSVTPQHTPPARLLLPVLGSVNNDKCRTSDADRSTLEVFHNCFSFISSVRSSNSHPDLLVIQQQHQPLFQITPVLNTGLSLSEPLQLYQGQSLDLSTDS